MSGLIFSYLTRHAVADFRADIKQIDRSGELVRRLRVAFI
jgi:hypothetical protein